MFVHDDPHRHIYSRVVRRTYVRRATLIGVRRQILLFSVALMASGCGDPPALLVDAAVDAAVVGQGSPPRGVLVINEVAPRPLPRPVGHAGDWPAGDYVELVNRSAEAVDLCGYFLTDGLDRLDHYSPLGGVTPPGECPPALLPAGQRLVIHADGAPEAGPSHARFKLGPADEVHVVTTAGVPMDGLVYLYTGDADARGAALARAPDSEGLFYPCAPSPGAVNPGDAEGGCTP